MKAVSPPGADDGFEAAGGVKVEVSESEPLLPNGVRAIDVSPYSRWAQARSALHVCCVHRRARAET
jgi:hypothetical protein